MDLVLLYFTSFLDFTKIEQIFYNHYLYLKKKKKLEKDETWSPIRFEAPRQCISSCIAIVSSLGERIGCAWPIYSTCASCGADGDIFIVGCFETEDILILSGIPFNRFTLFLISTCVQKPANFLSNLKPRHLNFRACGYVYHLGN